MDLSATFECGMKLTFPFTYFINFFFRSLGKYVLGRKHGPGVFIGSGGAKRVYDIWNNGTRVSSVRGMKNTHATSMVLSP